MARPQRITDEQIIAAARAVFLESGVQATTAMVAERAGVSEATLFKRYENKEQLFLASMSQVEAPAWVASVRELAGTGDLRENLVRILTELIAFHREILPRAMMVWSSRSGAESMPRGPSSPPGLGYQAMRAYFASEVAARRLRTIDPEVVAHTVLGTVHHLIYSEMLGLSGTSPAATQKRTDGRPRQIVDTLWAGIGPETSTAAPKQKTAAPKQTKTAKLAQRPKPAPLRKPRGK